LVTAQTVSPKIKLVRGVVQSEANVAMVSACVAMGEKKVDARFVEFKARSVGAGICFAAGADDLPLGELDCTE
jgi:hypothetical protein